MIRLILLAPLTFLSVAKANTSFPFSPQGSIIYEAVVEDSTNNSDLNPGLYAVNGKTGESTLMIPGKVNGVNRARPGVISYLSHPTDRESGHGVLSLIDSKLYVLNKNSRADKKNSFFVLGRPAAEGGLPLVDITHGTEVRLPEISSLEDISIFKGQDLKSRREFPNGLHLVLVSVKAPSPLGDGITFAMAVDVGRQNQGLSFLHGKGLVIGYDYMDEPALKRVITAQSHALAGLSYGTYSQATNFEAPLSAPSLITRQRQLLLRDGANRLNSTWTKQLNRFENYLKNGHSKDDKVTQSFFGSGVLDFVTLNETIPFIPVELVSKLGDEWLIQYFDPLTSQSVLARVQSNSLVSIKVGASNLHFLTQNLGRSSVQNISPTPIDRDPKSLDLMIVNETRFDSPLENTKTPSGHDTASIFWSNGSLYYMAKNSRRSGEVQVARIGENSTANASFFFKYFLPAKDPSQTPAHIVVLVRKTPGSKRMTVQALKFIERDRLELDDAVVVYTGPNISEKELSLRIRTVLSEDKSDVVVDLATPPVGPSQYLKISGTNPDPPGVEIEPLTVPYTSLTARRGALLQVYLKPLAERQLIPGILSFIEYNLTGASKNHVGFYLRDLKGAQTAIPGYPLVATKVNHADALTHIMYTKELASSVAPTMKTPNVSVSLVPYIQHTGSVSSKRDRKAEILAYSSNSFRMGIVVSPTNTSVGVKPHFEPSFNGHDFGLPFQSLLYTQILQGSKASSDEVHIIYVFAHDPKLPGSRDAVYVSSGKLSWKLVPDQPAELALAFERPSKIHGLALSPEKLATHLAIDPAGAYYWASEPLSDSDFRKTKIVKLSDPANVMNSRSGSLKNLRSLDAKDASASVAVGARGGFYYSNWQVFGKFGAEKIVPELASKAEKDKKLSADGKSEKEGASSTESKKEVANGEDVLMKGFVDYLNHEVFQPSSEQSPSHPRVLVVEPDLYDKFKLAFFERLIDSRQPRNLIDTKLKFFSADATLDDVEVSQELQFITQKEPQEQAKVLYVDRSLLLEKEGSIISRNSDEADDDESPKTSDYDFDYGFSSAKSDIPYPFSPLEADLPPSLFALVASNGKAKTAKGYRRLKEKQTAVPMLSIVTADDWRKIQAQNSGDLNDEVFKAFEVDYRFLTTAWTLWPPNTTKTAPEIKEMTKMPYRPEEMRIFPTLEKILNAAADGELNGKQKIVIVPPELKTLVQKLILLRWSASDRAGAGAWHYSNPKFSLNRIPSDNSTSQSVILDSFKAMRGASQSRTTVLYSELDTIEKIGRPAGAEPGQSSSLFRIKDPIRSNKNLLFESEMSATEAVEVPVQDNSDPILDSDDEELERLHGELSEINNDIESSEESMERMREEISEMERGEEKTALRSDLTEEKGRALELDRSRQMKIAEITEREIALGLRSAPAAEVKAVSDKSGYPHLLWLVATEGQRVQPKATKNWDLKAAVKPELTTLLVGTSEELDRLEASMAFEEKFFKIREHFDIVELEAPNLETRFNLVEQLFDRPEVNALGIMFELKQDHGRDPRTQIIHHFINRIEQLAYDQKIEMTSAFIRAYIALKNSLTEDLDLRRNRTIDERFIERIFARVFPMPLNPDILNPNDALVRLKDVERSTRDLQASGYQGSQDLKRRFIGNILSQTRPTDTSRPIPNSQILYGSTSTGKTLLLVTLFRMLGFVEYNHSKSNNDDADYIFINCAKITEQRTSEPDKIPIDEVIANILDILSGPKGARAHIVFDDFHKAPTKLIRERLSQFIQGLFEANGGMFWVKSKDGSKVREIPVQNLNLYITLNPTANESLRKQFVKETHKGSELLKREVLAAISGEGFLPEESFLARWSDIINLDQFPRSAKVPELVKRVRESSGKSNGKLILVDPEVIDSLIDVFPSAHAREFLSPATAALTSLPPSAQEAPMYIVSKAKTDLAVPTRDNQVVNNDVIKSVVTSITQVDPIFPGDPKSLINLMGFIMRNFRLTVYNNLSLESHLSETLKLSIPGQTDVLRNGFLLGTTTHVLDNPRLPNSEIYIRPENFSFYNRSQIDQLIYLHANLPKSAYFPVDLEGTTRDQSLDLNRFLDGRSSEESTIVNHQYVLLSTTARLEVILRKAMALYLRVPSGTDLRTLGSWDQNDLAKWFEQIQTVEPEREFKEVIHELIGEFLEFQITIASQELSNNFPGFNTSSIYDQVRLFSYALDKAIARMQWGPIAQFTLNVAQISSDFSLGSKPTFKDFVGRQQLSPFTISTSEFLTDMFKISESNLNPEMKDRVSGMRARITEACENLLLSKTRSDQ